MIELTSGVDFGQDHFKALLTAVSMDVDRDASSVVDDRDRTIGMQRDVDIATVAGHRLVDRIIHDLVDQMMQPARRCVTNIHPRTKPNRLDSLEYPDICSSVVRVFYLTILPLLVHGFTSIVHLMPEIRPDTAGRQNRQACPPKIAIKAGSTGPTLARNNLVSRRSPRPPASSSGHHSKRGRGYLSSPGILATLSTSHYVNSHDLTGSDPGGCLVCSGPPDRCAAMDG